MISITINRTESDSIQSFEISGHAFFANRGKDIVCAGVSAVSVGAINAVQGMAFSAVSFQKIFRLIFMRRFNFFLKV
jgi:uncharacterized protein YsxB (DUF464 family)